MESCARRKEGVGIVHKWGAERACGGRGGVLCLGIGGVCNCKVMHLFVGRFVV